MPPGATVITQVALADLNGDGYTDLAACAQGNNGTTGNAAVYLNDRSGNLIPGQVVALPAACRGIAAGDANHDGKVDLAITYFTGSVSAPANIVATWFGDGVGQFANAVNQPVALTATQDSSRNPCSVLAATGADFNGDGALDLLLFGSCQQSAVNTGDIYLARGDGTAHYALTKIDEGNTSVSTSPYVADINADGKPDVVYVQEQFGPHDSDGSDIDYALNNGAGFSLSKPLSANAYAGNGEFIEAGSPINGATTAVEGFRTESVSSAPATYGVKLFTNVNNPPAQTWIYGQATNFSLPGRVLGVAAADFDGNGLNDFAVAEKDANHIATLHVYLNH